MPQFAYIARKFSDASLRTIELANQICAQYQAQGFDLTLRQLYYQFVSRGLIPNKDTEYKRLGSTINDARLAGLLDWNYITDRTRNLRASSHWTDPASIIRSAMYSFALDKWGAQAYRPEVWIEKDALIGVIAGVCGQNDTPYFSCRGYTSQSEVWGAAQRLIGYLRAGKTPVIIHLGDHDPSGIDMTRDITDRLQLFLLGHGYDPAQVRRIALNWDQVQQYSPPPNPAKLTDSRVEGYMARFGAESWELDALEPNVLVALVQEAIDSVKDAGAWDESVAEQERQRELLKQAAERWTEVEDFLDDAG